MVAIDYFFIDKKREIGHRDQILACYYNSHHCNRHQATMKTVILAGGLGSRLSEETRFRPKPMVEIGGRPILWHILKYYSHHGYNEFIICCGYKAYIIKEYFFHYMLHNSDVTIDTSTNEVTYANSTSEEWKITLVETGLYTQTAGRLKQVRKYLDDEPFFFTYGDGLATVDLNSLKKAHHANKSLATLTVVQTPGRYGSVKSKDGLVTEFIEKIPDEEYGRINGGYFMCEPEAIELISGPESSWEYDVLPKLVKERRLGSYNHTGFWMCMDTVRDLTRLQELWDGGECPWKVWE